MNPIPLRNDIFNTFSDSPITSYDIRPGKLVGVLDQVDVRWNDTVLRVHINVNKHELAITCSCLFEFRGRESRPKNQSLANFSAKLRWLIRAETGLLRVKLRNKFYYFHMQLILACFETKKIYEM
jgi:hypothetical protein